MLYIVPLLFVVSGSLPTVTSGSCGIILSVPLLPVVFGSCGIIFLLKRLRNLKVYQTPKEARTTRAAAPPTLIHIIAVLDITDSLNSNWKVNELDLKVSSDVTVILRL
jgi:hypothetical protein